MINRRTILTVVSALLVSFCLPALASAQGNDPWWGRDRDDGYYRRDQDHDDDYYRRDRRNRRDRRDDYYGRYDQRYVRQVAQRLKDRAKQFEHDVDRFLDRSRVDGSRREDRINEAAQDFRRAAERFRDRVGDSRDLNRSRNEAAQLLQSADRVERLFSRLRGDSRTYSDWSGIRQDLRTVADIYGLRYSGYDDGYYRRGDNRYPDDRNRDGWWRRLPDIIGRP